MSTTIDSEIAESVRENRTVTLYPSDQTEFEALETDLLALAEDSADISGEGYSGAEARGSVEAWGTDDDGERWRIQLVRPRAEEPIIVPARRYEDSDDCLADAARDYAAENGLESWQVEAEWADDEREEIVITLSVSARR